MYWLNKTWPEKSLKKLLHLLALQCGLLKLMLYKSAVAHNLLPPHWKTRTWYCRSFLKLIFNGLPDPELRLHSDEVGLILSDFVNSQNNRYCSTESPHAIDKVPLHDLKVGIWWVTGAWRITRPVFLHEKLSSDSHMRLILSTSFD